MRNTILITMLAIVTGSLLIALKSREQEIPPRATVMIAEWERAKAYTRDYLNASSEELIGFKPTPEMRSFATQMLHLADDTFGFAALASGKKPPSEFGELEKAADQYKTKQKKR